MDASIDKAPCCYFAAGDDGILLEVNSTLCTHLGYTKEELAGKKLEDIFTIATRIFHQTHFFPLLKIQGKADELFITLQSRTRAPLPLLLNAERVEEEGRGVIRYAGIPVYHRKKFEDELVAARKAAEAALRENTALLEAREELQQHLEKLDRHMLLVNRQNEELRQFNRVVTHDLQEPLRKLQVYGNMIRSGDGNSREGAVAKLMDNLSGMRAILSGLQQYIWLTETPVRREPVNLASLMEEVREKVAGEAEGISLLLQSGSLPEVPADREQVTLLLYHLFSNAVRFRKPGSAALVQVTGTSIRRNRFGSIEGKYDYVDFLKIEVKDEGIGFDPDYKQQVFALFKRLHPSSGRGIGLSLCKKIMDNHGGEIGIDSRPGEGATLTLLFPMEEAEAASS